MLRGFLFRMFHHLSFFHLDHYLFSVVFACLDFYLASVLGIAEVSIYKPFSGFLIEKSFWIFLCTLHIEASFDLQLIRFILILNFGFCCNSSFAIFIFTLLFLVILIYNFFWLRSRDYLARSILSSRNISGVYSEWRKTCLILMFLMTWLCLWLLTQSYSAMPKKWKKDKRRPYLFDTQKKGQILRCYMIKTIC